MKRSASAMRGIAMVEFSLIAVLALFMLFGMLNFGAVLLVKQTLSRAANEGGLALLHSQQAGAGPSQESACAIARNTTGWLNTWRDERGLKPLTCFVEASGPCEYDPVSRCAALVVRYPDYGQHPLIPNLLPLNALMQRMTGSESGWLVDAVEGRATVQLEPGSIL